MNGLVWGKVNGGKAETPGKGGPKKGKATSCSSSLILLVTMGRGRGGVLGGSEGEIPIV